MKTSNSITVNTSVRTFIYLSFYAPFYVARLAQYLFYNQDEFLNLHFHSVVIYRRKGLVYFNCNFSLSPDTALFKTLSFLEESSSISDYDFRQLRNYFKNVLPGLLVNSYYDNAKK